MKGKELGRQSAFPFDGCDYYGQAVKLPSGEVGIEHVKINPTPGLTLRQHFAGLAMQGMLMGVEEPRYGKISEMAVGMADALLERLAL